MIIIIIIMIIIIHVIIIIIIITGTRTRSGHTQRTHIAHSPWLMCDVDMPHKKIKNRNTKNTADLTTIPKTLLI